MHMLYTLWYKSYAHFAKRLKSQDEELEHFHALEKERRKNARGVEGIRGALEKARGGLKVSGAPSKKRARGRQF